MTGTFATAGLEVYSTRRLLDDAMRLPAQVGHELAESCGYTNAERRVTNGDQ